jgi:hypothetical protein
MFNEGNQKHNFTSSSDSETVINNVSSSNFLTSYGSGPLVKKLRFWFRFHNTGFNYDKIPVWRIRDVYPGSRILILPIPDPKNLLSYFFCVVKNFTKFNIILVSKCWRKFFKNFYPKTMSLSSPKYGFGIRYQEQKIIQDKGSRNQNRSNIIIWTYSICIRIR